MTGPDGKDVPAQISGNKVIFLASVPSVGYAVYDVQPGAAVAGSASHLQVSKEGLENEYYRVKLNADGDVASIFDKAIGKELLSAPARLAISYDNPAQWPAWNMDWDQEQAAPKAFVSGPAQIRVVEDGPVRVAVEVSRETAGSRFVQTISLSAGDAGKRVEFGNVIDWNTRESNLKATFPLTASNHMATYNWDIGTIERPTAEPKKFEVPSHQWIDLDRHERRVRRDHSDRLQERIGQADRQHHPPDADPNARHSRRLCRPGHAGSRTSRVRLRDRRARRRLARRANRLAGAAIECSADRLRNFKARRRARPDVLPAESQQFADSRSGGEES